MAGWTMIELIRAAERAEPPQPITLARWRVMRIDRGDHLVGINAEDNRARISSQVDDYDGEAMTAITRSGRCYHLHGLPGFNDKGRYILRHWVDGLEVIAEDVTDEYAYLSAWCRRRVQALLKTRGPGYFDGLPGGRPAWVVPLLQRLH